MTETPIMSGGATATDDGVGMLPSQSDGDGGEGGANRRRLLIIGTVAGIIILAAAAYLLLHKSSSTTTATVVPRGVVKAAPVKPKAVTKTPTHKAASTTLPKVAKHPVARDPFLALVTAPVTTGGTAASSSTVGAPTTTPTTGTTTGTQPIVTPTTGTTTTTGTGKTAGGPLWIQLISANGTTAHFKVGYAHSKFRNFTVQAPKATSDQATIFAKIFALIAVQNGEATVQIGDGAPFILTQGISHVS
jgi:hypothetical protein